MPFLRCIKGSMGTRFWMDVELTHLDLEATLRTKSHDHLASGTSILITLEQSCLASPPT